MGQYLYCELIKDNSLVIAPSSNQLDITKKDGFLAFDFSKIETIVHAAGKVFVPNSWKDPESFYQVNVIGTQHILDVCREYNIPLVYISGYVYGSNVANPINEAVMPKPNNPYAHSKYLGEELCRFYSENFNAKVTVLRPFNIIGEGQNPDFLVSKIITQTLYNDHIEVMDLSPKRDYIYIQDVVSAVRKAICHDAQFEIFNVGSGISYSVKEVIEIVQMVAGTNKEVTCSNNKRNNEIDNVFADISKIKDRLNWNPRYSLHEAIEMIINKERSYGK